MEDLLYDIVRNLSAREGYILTSISERYHRLIYDVGYVLSSHYCSIQRANFVSKCHSLIHLQLMFEDILPPNITTLNSLDIVASVRRCDLASLTNVTRLIIRLCCKITNFHCMTSLSDLLISSVDNIPTIPSFPLLIRLKLFNTEVKTISDLSSLEELEIDSNQHIQDISKFTTLKKLVLKNTSIRDISKLTNLQCLEIGEKNPIEAISSLTNLTKLKILENKHIRTLDDNTKLLSLDLTSNSKVKSIDTLVNLTRLCLFNDYKIKDRNGNSCLKNLTKLKYLDIGCSDDNSPEERDIGMLSELEELKVSQYGQEHDIRHLKKLRVINNMIIK